MKDITRKELYEKVWQVPMSRLAKEFGLSDVGLAKICKKHNIPRPPRGYWAKVNSRYHVKKTALPKPKLNDVIIISPAHGGFTKRTLSRTDEDAKAMMDFPEIIVGVRLKTPHPLIKKAAEFMELSKEDSDGLIKIRSGCLDIRVSLQNKRRALRIMDSLVKFMETQGYSVVVQGKETWVRMLGEELRFGIFEGLESKRIEAESNQLQGNYRFHHCQYKYIKKPSGRLCLSIYQIQGHYIYNIRKNWKDTENKSLDNQLNSFLQGLVKIVLQKKYDKERAAEKERIKQEKILEQDRQENLLVEKRKMIEIEKNKVQNLLRDAKNKAESDLIRKYISQVVSQQSTSGFAYEPANNLQEWISWATTQADRLDPFINSLPSILDEESELEEKEKEVLEARRRYHW